MKRAYEYNLQLELLFVDFQSAFDTIKKRKLIKALIDMGIAPKIVRLIKVTTARTKISVRIGDGETDSFIINKSKD